MLLFFEDKPSGDEFTGGLDVSFPKIVGQDTSLQGLSLAIKNAVTKGLDPVDQFKKLSAIEDKATELQKTIGSGMILGGAQFRERLEEIYFKTSDVGVQFKDITDLIGGLSKGVGMMIDPSDNVVERMSLLSKNVGLAREAMGGLISDFMKLTFSQEKSADLIEKITDRARRAGVNANNTLTSIQKNLSKVDAYGFKNGVDGLTKMTIQAQQLKTSVEDIGAIQMGQTFWDPEKAIETAAGMSMLGGSVSDLMNPFQLMNMGANDAEKLQEKLIDLSASAFKVDEATGKVETNFIAQQRLKRQLEEMGRGGDYEKFVNMGREAAKQAQIIEKLNSSNVGSLFQAQGGPFTEEDQRLIASLSEIGKDGKVTLKIPGEKNIIDLNAALSDPAGLKKALTDYQAKADMSEREIAEKSLSTVDKISAKITRIEQALLMGLEKKQRTEFLETVGKEAETAVTSTETGTKTAVVEINNEIMKGGYFDIKDDKMTPQEIERIKQGKSRTASDAFFGGDKKILTLGKGQMFNFIEEDQAVFAPNLDEKLSVLKTAYMKIKELEIPKLKETTFKNPFESISTTSKVETKTEQTVVQKVEGSGTININVNITSSGNLADTLMSDRRFRNQLESEVLATIKNKDILMVKKP